eukprot:364801-Chlamydomonas_euryale.AAC.5
MVVYNGVKHAYAKMHACASEGLTFPRLHHRAWRSLVCITGQQQQAAMLPSRLPHHGQPQRGIPGWRHLAARHGHSGSHNKTAIVVVCACE